MLQTYALLYFTSLNFSLLDYCLNIHSLCIILVWVYINWYPLKFGIKRVNDWGYITTARLKSCCFERQLFIRAKHSHCWKGPHALAQLALRASAFYFLMVDFDRFLNFSRLMFYAVQYVKVWCCCRFRCHANYWLSCIWKVAHFRIAVLPDWRIPRKEDKKRKMDLVRWLFRMIG